MMRVAERIRGMGMVGFDTFEELRRQPTTMVVGLVAILAAGGGWWWRDFNFGSEQGRFLLDFGWGVQGLVATMFAIVATAQVMLREFEQGTAAVALARPLNATAWLAGKWLGVGGWVAVYLVLSTGWLADVLSGNGLAVPVSEMAGTVALLFLKQLLVIAYTGWLASYGRTMVFVVLATLLIVGVGQLRFLIVDAGGAVDRFIFVVPQMRLFDMASWNESGGLTGGRLTGVFAYAASFGAVLLGLATWSLSRRDF